jgi:DNA-binding NarL/FixJ family response regulator
MARISCLAGIAREHVTKLSDVLEAAGVPPLHILLQVHVVELGELKPGLLVCDIDGLAVDPLELLRQVRFVLPACIIMVFTATTERSWIVDCHLAGANGLLSKASTNAQLTSGVRGALRNGCFTDPRFVAA